MTYFLTQHAPYTKYKLGFSFVKDFIMANLEEIEQNILPLYRDFWRLGLVTYSLTQPQSTWNWFNKIIKSKNKDWSYVWSLESLIKV